jgi:phosphatidylglycerophosphate synthase
MNLWLAALIILGAAAVSAAGMLIVRRRAPAGTYFRDVVPAGAVYTVIGTAYMVILAFVFFVAFESYHAASSDAQDEATATLAMFHAAALFSSARDRLQGQVICYGREVVSKEWATMREGKTSPTVDARVTALERDAGQVPVSGEKQAGAYDHLFALNEDRRKGRQGRIAEASPVIPPLIWLILIIGGVVVIATVGFFADAEERRLPQAAIIAAVTAIVVSGLILVRFLDRPYENKSGSIKPTAMTRTLGVMQREYQEQSRHARIPCA